MKSSRRSFLRSAAAATAALAARPASLRAAEPPFADRGYYLTFMRMPTFGLPQWKQIIDCVHADGGEVRVHSVPDEGSCFRLLLPELPPTSPHEALS